LSFNDQSVGSMNDTTAMGCFDGTQIFSFSSAPSALTQVSGIISAHDSQEGLQGLGACATVVGFALGASKEFQLCRKRFPTC
jgi:hypothetical protein